MHFVIISTNNENFIVVRDGDLTEVAPGFIETLMKRILMILFAGGLIDAV